MRIPPWAALLAATACTGSIASECDVSYEFRAAWDGQPRRFAARVSFEAGGRTQTAVRLSTEWGGVADFHAGVREMRGASPDASVAQAEIPNRWIVKHPREGRVEVRYDVVNRVPNIDGDAPLAIRDFHRNALGAGHFQLSGHGILLQLEPQRDSDPLDACLEFTGLPAGWSFASSDVAGHLDGRAAWKVRAAPQRLRSTLFLGGDYRLLRRDIAGRPLWIALRGTWGFADARFADGTAKVVESHRRFWEDFDFPHYLVSLSPNRASGGSTGGTALHHAFAMHASKDFSVPGSGFAQILAHEHLHTWLPRRLGTMGMGGEATRYWFSEGFTNYLTHRLLVRSGFWTLQDYASALNEELRQHFISPAREIPNSEVQEGFWKDPVVQKVPYRRGEFFAIHLASRLAARGASMEDALRQLKLPEGGVARELDAGPADLAVNRLRAALRATLGESVDADLRSYIDVGRLPAVGESFLGPCFAGRWVEKPVFELGFDAAIVHKSWKLGSVVAGSAAERAGLREGMQVQGWSYNNGQPEHEVSLKIREEGGVREVKYLPMAAQGTRVPQFTVRTGAAVDPGCLAWAAQES